jgi:periplasmic protein TonB
LITSRLLVALGASLALHVLVIATMRAPQRLPVVVAAPPLVVELAKEKPAPEAESVPAAPVTGPAQRTHEQRIARQHETLPAAKPVSPPLAVTQAPTPAIPAPAPVEIAVVSAQQEHPAVANRESAATRAVPSAPSGAPAQNEVRVDTRQALLAYGRLLSQAIAREQRYPPMARENGWQGTVEIALDVAGNRLRDVTVVRSSGYGVLDQRALEMARAVAPLPPLPEALARQDFKVQVPITFRLHD